MKYMFTIFEDFAEGAEFYRNNGSIWLIFTKDKRWVIELTEQGTLWYNYYFFHKIFNLLGMDIEENQHTITEWVEDTIQNRVRNTRWEARNGQLAVEDTIQNGVIHTAVIRGAQTPNVEDTIQNGVRNTFYVLSHELGFIEDTIQNGVKHIEPGGYLGSIEMKGKIVHQFESPKQNNEVEDTIQNGVKYTPVPSGTYHWRLEDTIQNGVKHTEKSLQIDGSCVIEDVIKEGVKHTEYGDWLDGDERLDEIIQNGIKETRLEQNITEGEIDDIIQNGINETWGYEKQPQNRIYEVIKNGIKENPS